jgi:hypothetical protein
MGVEAAEELAERCVEACNQARHDGDATGLAGLLLPGAVIEVAELTTDVLAGPDELAQRLADAGHHGDLVLVDVRVAGPDVVAGLAWDDDPTTRTAELRLVPAGDRVAHLEWVR